MIPVMWQGAPTSDVGSLGIATPSESANIARVQAAIATAAAGGNPTSAALESVFAPHKTPKSDAAAYLWAAYRMALAAASSGNNNLLLSAQSALAKSMASYAIPGESFISGNVTSIMQSATAVIASGSQKVGLWAIVRGAMGGERPPSIGPFDWWFMKWGVRTGAAVGGVALIWGTIAYVRHRKGQGHSVTSTAMNSAALASLFRRALNEKRSPDADVETDEDDDDGEA